MVLFKNQGIFVKWIGMKIMVINNVYQYVDLIARCQCINCTSFCTSNEQFLTKSIIKTIVFMGKETIEALNCLFFHLNTKLCLTNFCSLGLKYSMDFSLLVLSQTKVNFFKQCLAFDIVVSITNLFHSTIVELEPLHSTRHNGIFSMPQSLDCPYKHFL